MLSPTELPALPPLQAVVLGASAGAVEALQTLLPALPAGGALPLVVVVHTPPRHRSLLPELFGPRCAMRVREAEDKLPVAPGTVWFAPADYHLLIEHDRHFALSVDDPVNYSRPSIDVLFESAVDAYGAALMAVVLTGANADGAAGAAAVRRAGGFVVAQDPAEAEIGIMPRAAIDAAQPQVVASLSRIAALLRIAMGGAS
jgi:two-component system chemotaxis response regulator CheB